MQFKVDNVKSINKSQKFIIATIISLIISVVVISFEIMFNNSKDGFISSLILFLFSPVLLIYSKNILPGFLYELDHLQEALLIVWNIIACCIIAIPVKNKYRLLLAVIIYGLINSIAFKLSFL